MKDNAETKRKIKITVIAHVLLAVTILLMFVYSVSQQGVQ